MKLILTLTFICLFFSYNSLAQTGVYLYSDKATKETIELNLRRDGVFFYTQSKDWNNAVTQGKWRPLGSGRVVLTSDYQLDNYTIEEIEDPTLQSIHIVIQSKSKGQSPTTISKIFMNEDETAQFNMDSEAILAMLEERQKLAVSAPIEVRDSLKNNDAPRFYKYDGQKELKSITLEFDSKEITVNIENPKANKIILTTAFAPNAAYHYMKKVEFISDGKFIREEGSSIKLKKQKR